MILKAIVEQIVDQYSARVRVPEYHKIKGATGATPTENLPIATVAVQAGTTVSLAPNDVVFVEFEFDQTENPVILGFLYNSTKQNSETDSTLSTLVVKDKAVLPKDTTIGTITADRLDTISFLISQIADGESGALLRRINNLDNSLSLNYNEKVSYTYSPQIELCSFVMYDSQLYRCKVDTSGSPENPEKFDPTKWDKIQVSSELQAVWAEIRAIKAGGRVKISELIVDIAETTWEAATEAGSEAYKSVITVQSYSETMPNISKVICSYDTEHGTLSEIDARREQWVDKDVYLLNHIVEGSNVNLTFIANSGKPEILLKANLLIFLDVDPDSLNGMVPSYIDKKDPSTPKSQGGRGADKCIWINPDTKSLYYKDSDSTTVQFQEGTSPVYVSETDPKDTYGVENYTWINPQENTLKYKVGTEYKQLGTTKLYEIAVNADSGWDSVESTSYPAFKAAVETTIPTSTYPTATQIFPLIQPAVKEGGKSIWLASKHQCYIEKVTKVSGKTNFVAEVYCQETFTETSDSVTFQIFDLGLHD